MKKNRFEIRGGAGNWCVFDREKNVNVAENIKTRDQARDDKDLLEKSCALGTWDRSVR